MPDPTIAYRVTSEQAGIEVGSARYRANRSARRPAGQLDGPSVIPSGAWTLWHDDRDGGSHTVGYADAYGSLQHAMKAAVDHEQDCQR